MGVCEGEQAEALKGMGGRGAGRGGEAWRETRAASEQRLWGIDGVHWWRNWHVLLESPQEATCDLFRGLLSDVSFFSQKEVEGPLPPPPQRRCVEIPRTVSMMNAGLYM